MTAKLRSLPSPRSRALLPRGLAPSLGAAALCALAWPTLAATPTGEAAAARAKPGATTAAQQSAAAAGELANLDLLRQRLAEKLGAAAPAASAHPGVMRVTNPAEGGADADATRASPSRSRTAARAPATLALAARAPGEAARPPQRRGPWSYGGENGPASWAELDPAFGLCASGRRQSPIDIRGGVAVDLEPIRFDYRPSGFTVVDDGHTIQARIAPGNTLSVGGRSFELQQMHFHRPAEERIDGRGFDMSLHLVHKDAEGRLAVLALLLQRGDEAQAVVQRVWNDLPLEKGLEQPASQPLDPAALLPQDRGYATYMGSLTTPPCSEDVLWMVMRQPLSVTQAQLDVFAHLYPMNARPLQSAAGRLIKRSP
jgi:carbonic anhydrase